MAKCVGAAVSTWVPQLVFPGNVAIADDSSSPSSSSLDLYYIPYETRDRNRNKNVIIRDDYYYMTGRLPPRILLPKVRIDDPKFNAWGACLSSESSGGGQNSCTYVSLNQRIPAYSKYAISIALGANSYRQVGNLLESISKQSNDDSASSSLWNEALSYLEPASNNTPPSPAIDALLKMILFASAMLTSPNYSGPPMEMLVARFYVNELGFAINELSSAIAERDIGRAKVAWQFGKDSWNSYFAIVNRAIVPKVGDKFEPLS